MSARPGPPAGPPTGPSQGAAAGYHPRRTLSFGAELRRQLPRRRTQLALGMAVLLPVLLACALKLGTAQGPQDGVPSLVQLAGTGAVNFTLFTLFAATGLFLVVIVAVFAGDAVAGEASWSSLRYLLIAPVPRSRLLRRKLLVACAFGGAALVLLTLAALLAGWLAFGWAPVRSPMGTTLSSSEALVRLGIAVCYLAVMLLTVAAVAFALGVRTDAPLGPVGGTVLLMVVSTILDAVPSLGAARSFLPTHYQYAWLDLLGPAIHWDEMQRGAALSIVYTAVLLALAWRHFLRKDILS
jgi:ABC-2 type transport system permease protein